MGEPSFSTNEGVLAVFAYVPCWLPRLARGPSLKAGVLLASTLLPPLEQLGGLGSAWLVYG